MTNLTNEQINALLEMRGKATQGEWETDGKNLRDADHGCFLGSMAAIADHRIDPCTNVAYIVAMHNALEDLCRMALERNKYKEEFMETMLVEWPSIKKELETLRAFKDEALKGVP